MASFATYILQSSSPRHHPSRLRSLLHLQSAGDSLAPLPVPTPMPSPRLRSHNRRRPTTNSRSRACRFRLLTFFGVDIAEIHRENAADAPVEYRSACVFAKRIVEKRRKIKSCFERVISPSPPPPPPAGGVESAQWAIENEETRRVNGDDGTYGSKPPDEASMFADEVRGSIDETNAIVQQLGESNPILRGFLVNAMEEMRQSIVRVSDGTTKASDYYGRRLMQRQFDYPTYMNEILIDHPIMTQFGKEGLPGVTIEGCEALCEGVSVFSNRTDKRECRALAFKRVDPFSTTDFTGRCYLLQNAGSCKVEDFASELYTRQIESEEVCHKPVSHYENPLCIQLPTTRTDTRVLTHFDATAIAAQTPTPAAPGSGGLPQPRTTLEAGFFIALARREGIYSFWSANPDTTNGNVTLHWITEGGSELVYRQGESRCVLVSSATSTAATKMYASLEPCTAKLADGVLTVAAAAAPPPPPGWGCVDPGKLRPHHRASRAMPSPSTPAKQSSR